MSIQLSEFQGVFSVFRIDETRFGLYIMERIGGERSGGVQPQVDRPDIKVIKPKGELRNA